MKPISSILVVVWIALSSLTPSALGGSNDLELIVRSFPDIAAPSYHPDEAVRTANAFISVGEKAACEALDRLASPGVKAQGPDNLIECVQLNRKICHLCRLLFLPKDAGEPLRPAKLGLPVDLPYGSMDHSLWPFLPFAITNGIPLSMNLGYAGSGVAERAKDYLAYCKASGKFRVESFAQPSFKSASNALNQVFVSVAWKSLRWKDRGPGFDYDIDEPYVKKLLWKQVENLK